MAKFETELLRRLPEYRADGVLDEANAGRLEAHLKNLAANPQNSIFKNALYLLGTTLICLGLILAVAYNWDGLPRAARIALAFAPISISAAVSLYTAARNKYAAWREVSAVLNIAGVIAMISLLSQIFQIMGDLRLFLISIMGLAALPMIVVMRSYSAAIILAIFASIYSFPMDSQTPMSFTLAIGAFAVALGFSFYRYKSAGWLQLGAVCAICIMSAIFIPVAVGGSVMLEELAVPIFFGTCASLSLLAATKYFNDSPKLPVSLMGIIGFLSAAAMLNFDATWVFTRFPDINRYGFFNAPAIIFFGVCALWLAFFIAAVLNGKRNFGLISSALFFPYILLFMSSPEYRLGHIPVSNLITFACGFLFFAKGFRDQSARVMNLGLLIILFLAGVKFASDDLPILVRAAMLAGAGAFLIAANMFLGKRKAVA